MQEPVILCGLGRIGWRVLEHLQAAGLKVVVIDTRCAPDDPRLGTALLVSGDCRSKPCLEQAGIRTARGVLIMTNDDLINISTALIVRHQNPQVRIVMRLFNQNLIPRLGKAVANVIALSTAALTAPLFALSALTGQALGTIRLGERQDQQFQLAEINLGSHSPFRHLRLEEFASLNQLRIVAHQPAGERIRFPREIDPSATLREGDRVIVCAPPEKITAAIEGLPDTTDVRWAGWFRRFGRVAWRTMNEVDLAVKISGAVLVGVVLISTIVLHSSVSRYHWAHAFFRTISLMATGSDMHGEELDQDWLKVYASILRITGAALMGAFTAIFTNYLLRARLGGALEYRRIPDSGHVVVCGLGNIGYRVVEELVRCRERVVVIEQVRDSRFVTTARRLGVPVLIGDATVIGVLEQAHAAAARAVITATSDDLVNLEIALLVRELNPRQRVVLHLTDPNLAQTLREAANIRLALSIPTLAAPMFMAALYGDRVQNAFMIDGRLLGDFDLVIAADDPCLTGQFLQAAAVDYGLVPVAVVDQSGQVLATADDVRLEAGCRLIAIAALPDLERLLRREAVLPESGVELTRVPPAARVQLVDCLRRYCSLNQSTSDSMWEMLPVRLATRFTRGQAQHLITDLGRAGISAYEVPAAQP